ncbi:hypothetical protein [Sphingobacterium daejeonense]|uniref:hypothetical protein n=1 Tax=Sphingobacterium daejeonense TaxID=371142 RepID=UPI003D31C3AE
MNNIINNNILNQLINNPNTEYGYYNNGIQLQSIPKSKYERHIHIGTKNIVLRHLKKLNKLEITKRSNQLGKPKKLTPEQVKVNRAKTNKKYKSKCSRLNLIDSLQEKSTGIKVITRKESNKYLNYWGMQQYSRYDYNTFVNLNYVEKFILDNFDKFKTNSSDDFSFNIQQDKYNQKKHINLNLLKQLVDEFIEFINAEGKIKIEYGLICFEGLLSNNLHSHLLLQITNPNDINLHNYLLNRWKFSRRKKKAVKRVKTKNKHNQIKNIVSYMLKENDNYGNDITVYPYNIDENTPISYITKMDNRGNYNDKQYFSQLNNAG